MLPPIEVQIQMRQFVNDGEPEIIHAIVTECQTNHWASVRGVKTSAIKVSFRQVLKDDKMNALLVQQDASNLRTL